MSRDKGNKRERQAREIFEDAGFAVEKASPERYGRTDWFHLFDFMAVRPDQLWFLQVKSGSAEMITEITEWAGENAPESLNCGVVVVHKREGWRLVKAKPAGDTYRTVCDERKLECKMGVGLTEYLHDGSE